MKYLSTYTPAEIYIIRKQKVDLQEFLKITFIDLIFKRVLDRFEVERQYNSNQSVRIYDYIGAGEKFKDYTSKRHEQFFTKTFQDDSEIGILFRNLIKIGYQNSKTKYNFKKEILQNKSLNKVISQNVFEKLFNFYSLTELGQKIKTDIDKEIIVLNEEFKNEINIEKKVLIKANEIGANIFFINNVSYDLLNQIDHDLIVEMTKSKSSNYSGCTGCAWYFDDYSSSFDSGCSSGCGSGCSGCSGCGGCGGCGG